MSSRVQLALNVTDIDQAIAFYTKLFGTEPAKVRLGYANFAIADPPLKLVLLAGSELGETTCCYAAQDKFWVAGAPDGEAWEIYTVLADSPTFYAEGHGEACCGGTGTCQAGKPATAAAQCC